MFKSEAIVLKMSRNYWKSCDDAKCESLLKGLRIRHKIMYGMYALY